MCGRGNRHTGLYVATRRLTRRNHDNHSKRTQGTQQELQALTTNDIRRTTRTISRKPHKVLRTVQSRMGESIVAEFTIAAQKSRAFNLSPLLGEREGQIGSWPTAQAETSKPLRCVARVETLPLKGPRLLIRHWILDAKEHTDNILRLLKVSTSLPTQADHTKPYHQVLQNQGQS
jgi:hypothetical protein